MSEIKNTKLFKELKKLNKELANDVLKNSSSIIELINKKTTINFPNYTNHDIRHSIKIMETIYELIKDKNKQFSSIEYALMIYSAMFHDIGMAVSDEEITNIKNENSKYLYNQSFKLIKEGFNNNEELAIQEVVRNAHGKIANDLINTKYKELFKLPQSSTYFSEDLGMICQAHTEDKNYLNNISIHKTKGYDEYNPRFIAILLRVADILDIDDSRTPIELYNTIDLSEFSDSEWQKNFVIENKRKIFSRNKLKEIRLEGTCEDIKVHRKLLNYIKWIENELSIAVNETANMKEQYHIQINTQVQNKIESKGYSIPDLKLNMDYHAVTNLLMGEAIYGSKDLGLRELLQNSIDAIMVKKDKLEMEKHPLKDTYEPTINIDIDEKNNKVIIKDNGMGMNEYIIKNYFLNVGKSYYKSKDFLNFKHNYNPIGNFGIGFLSCFMLSNEVQVITKYFDSNKKYIIDLEKDSEYIAFREDEDNSSESGTLIILELESFFNIIKQTDDKQKYIENFITKYILIEDFIIFINNIKYIQEKNISTLFENKIDISKYLKNINGYININKANRFNKIEYDMQYAEGNFFFNGKNFIQINSIKDLNFDEIIKDKEIEYCKIPLLDTFDENKIKEVLEITSWDVDQYIKNNYLQTYICLFLKNTYHFNNIYNNLLDYNQSIIVADSDEESTIEEFHFRHLKEDLPDTFDMYNVIVGLMEKTSLYYKDNEMTLPIKKDTIDGTFFYTKNNHSIYIKNIRLNQPLKFMSIQRINLEKIQININSNIVNTNISRTNLTKYSEIILSDAIGKIILLYSLENLKLEDYEKELINKMLEDYYYLDNPLLIKHYN